MKRFLLEDNFIVEIDQVKLMSSSVFFLQNLQIGSSFETEKFNPVLFMVGISLLLK